MPEKWARWAGRGLTSAIVFDEVDPTCHPLGPNNKLVIAPGWVTGTPAAPSSGRTSFGAKSPLTGGIKKSNAGGLSGQKIAKLGLAAIIIEGTPAKRQMVHPHRQPRRRAVRRCRRRWSAKACTRSTSCCGNSIPDTAVIGIGQAGEMKLSNAGISVNDMENKPGRYAGRGGLGAVMGARGVKAMVVDDTGGPGVEIANQDLFKQGRRKLTESIQEHGLTKKDGGLNSFGTAVLVNILNEAGGLPTRNFSAGQFEGAAKISGEAIAEVVEALRRGGEGLTGHGCHPGCIIKCSNVYPDETAKPWSPAWNTKPPGRWAPTAASTIWTTSPKMTRVCNDMGVDTIEAGNTIAVAMEGGLLNFGDAEGALDLFAGSRQRHPAGPHHRPGR